MTNWYVTQTGSTTNNGGINTPWSVSGYNNSNGTVQPGDIVNLSGTIAQEIIVPSGGQPGNPITIFFLPGASITALVFSGTLFPNGLNSYVGGAIWNNNNYITINGGTNGIIQCTGNGSAPTYPNSVTCAGILLNGCTGVTVQNLTIANIYVMNNPVDPYGAGAGIVNFWEGGPSPTNITVTNCIFHDMYVGFSTAYGPSSSNIVMSYCTAYNCDWGGNAGDDISTNSLSGLVVHDNQFYNWTNWDNVAGVIIGSSGAATGNFIAGETVKQSSTNATAVLVIGGIPPNYSISTPALLITTQTVANADGTHVWSGQTSNATFTPNQIPAWYNPYHHNGFYAWAEAGGILINPTFYNNIFGPGYGNEQTAGLYMSCQDGSISGSTVYNNIFVCTSGGYTAADGLFTLRGDNGTVGKLGGVHSIYNNDFIGCGASAGTLLYINGGQATGTFNVKNNLGVGYGSGSFIAVLDNKTVLLNSNFNLGYGLDPNGPYIYAPGNSSVFLTFTQWQASGFDLNSPTGNPLLTSNYRLSLGSQGIQSGTNLSAFFNTDAANNPRPSSGPWDIGAYQYLVYRLKRLGSHLKMYGYTTN